MRKKRSEKQIMKWFNRICKEGIKNSKRNGKHFQTIIYALCAQSLIGDWQKYGGRTYHIKRWLRIANGEDR